MNRPMVTAIVLNYRSPRDTVKCVQALLAQTMAQEIDILVVDNHSDDESIGFLRAQLTGKPNVRIIEERQNTGYGRGNNDASTYAVGEYLLIINPDNVLPPDGLERLLSILKTHPDAGIVGPALMYPDGTLRPSARRFPTMGDLLRKRLFPRMWHDQFEAENRRLQSGEAIEVDWLVGACLLMRRDLYEKLGGFDERYFLFFEDIDLCRRIKGLGKKVLYAPSVRVQDRQGRLSGSSILSLLTRKTTWIHLSSAMKYFLKWGLGAGS